MPVRGTDNGRPSYVVIRTSGKLYTNDIVVVLGIRRLVRPDASASTKRLKFTRAHKIVIQICALVPGLPVGGGGGVVTAFSVHNVPGRKNTSLVQNSCFENNDSLKRDEKKSTATYTRRPKYVYIISLCVQHVLND